MHHCTYCIMDNYSIERKLTNEVSSTVRCDRYPFYFRFFFSKLIKICLYNTKFDFSGNRALFLAMIHEDLEAKKRMLVHL